MKYIRLKEKRLMELDLNTNNKKICSQQKLHN